MKQLLYLEIPTPDFISVRQWLQDNFSYNMAKKTITPDGIQLHINNQTLQIFIWSLQRTTYLKVFRWSDVKIPGEKQILTQLETDLRREFPIKYPVPPQIDLSKESIFTALKPYYPETVKFFQKMPQGEYDLKRAYWWEMKWRESVKNPQQPKQVIFTDSNEKYSPPPRTLSEVEGRGSGGEGVNIKPNYDLIYIGGALGVIHAAVMAKLGYKVLLIERLNFGRMNREWNISRDEFQTLINLGLFTQAEFESLIARDYIDGFNKFFDGNNPPHLKAPILHTPTVLNIGLESDKLIKLCGEKLKQA
ncbi:MAG TPA: flavin-dependent dehydrogenase, partial [Allocoleopsis sp.]